MNMIQCAYCKSLIPEASRFCTNCGRIVEGPDQEIEQQTFAPNTEFFPLLGGSASPPHGNMPVVQGTPQIDGVPFVRGTPQGSGNAEGGGGRHSAQTDDAPHHEHPSAHHDQLHQPSAGHGQPSAHQPLHSAPHQGQQPPQYTASHFHHQQPVDYQHQAPPQHPPSALPQQQPRSSHQASQLFHHGAKVQRGFRLTFLQAVISGAAIVAIIGAAVAALLLPQLLGSHAQSPLPGLFLNGNIVPGGIVSLHGSGFSSGGTVTIAADGHPATIAGNSSPHQASYDGQSLASLPFITSRAATTSPSGTGVSVGNDGTFDVNIRIDSNWYVGSSHLIGADEQGNRQKAQIRIVVPQRPALTNCSAAATTTTLALGPVDEGQKQSVSTAFALCTRGSGVVSWTSSWDQKQAGWLQLPQSGKIQAPLKQNLRVSASAAGLKAGTYATTVTFNSKGSNATVILKVMLIVRAANAPSCINTSTQSLSFTVTQGQGNPPAQTVTITNCANTDHWTASTSSDEGAKWLNAGSTAGPLNSKATQDVSISVSSANLGISTYTGQVTFKMGSSVAIVNVMLTVQPPQSLSCISAAQTSLSFIVTQGNSQSQSATIGNCGGSGSWSASSSTTDGTSWLSVNPSHGTLAANDTRDVGVQVSSTNLQIGTFFGQVTFKMGSSTAIVNVVLDVQSQPVSRACLSASPHFLPFTSSQGQGDPSPQTVTLANCGDQGNWSASTAHGAIWLSVSPVSGSLKGGDSEDVSIAVSSGNLPPGKYSENITFTIKSSTGQDSKTVSVTFTVQPPKPCIEVPASISFTVKADQGDPSPQTIKIHNCGPDGPWSATKADGATWLSVSPMSGSLKEDARQDITFSVSSKGLSAGQYTERVIFTITNSAGEPDQEHTDVTFIITSHQYACIQPDPDSISFLLRTSSSSSHSAALATIQSQDVFDSQTLPFNDAKDVTLTNCGDPGDWSASVATDDGANWLRVNTKHGSLTHTGDPQVVSVGADSSGLKPGKYTGSITFTIKTSSGAQADTIVAVMLNVPEVKPCIQPDPSSLSFTATQGQGDPSAQTVTIKNCGSSAGDWSASVATNDGANWLGVNPAKGTLQSGETQDVTVGVTTGNLKAGMYSGHITFTLGSATTTVSVTLTIQRTVELCALNPQSLSFTATQGQGDPATQKVTLTNCGSSPGDWSAAVAADDKGNWLGINPARGTVPSGGTQDVTVGAATGSLKAGTYSGHITFTLGSTTGTVSVTFTVSAPPTKECIQSNQQLLSFTATQGQSDPAAQTVTITNCGGRGDWSASVATNDGVSWLGVNPAKGTLQGGGTQDVTVGVTTGNLKAGTYSGQVTFTLGSATATVSVTFTVSAPPTKECIRSNQQSLSFTATQGQSDPAAQTVTITNCGGRGDWSASVATRDGASWLGVNPAKGALQGGGTQDVTVGVTTGNLKAGTYSGQVTFTLGSATATVSVTFTVSAPPTIEPPTPTPTPPPPPTATPTSPPSPTATPTPPPPPTATPTSPPPPTATPTPPPPPATGTPTSSVPLSFLLVCLTGLFAITNRRNPRKPRRFKDRFLKSLCWRSKCRK